MKKAALFPVVVAAALFGAIGFGVGVVTGSGTSTSPDSVPVGTATENRENEPQPDAAPGPSTSRREGGKPRRSKTVSLDAALPSISVPGLAQGDGEITGHVRTADGDAVDGVTMRLSPAIPLKLQPDGRDEADVPPAELIEAYARRVLYARTHRAETLTDADGAFRFSALNGDTKYAVSGRKDGREIQPSDPANAARASIGQVVEFTAKEVIRLEVQILLPVGIAPERASLSIVSGTGSRRTQAWSTAKPHVDLPPGTYDILATAGDEQQFKSPKSAIELKPGEPPEPLELALGGRPGIRGELAFEEADGSKTIHVWAARVDAGSEMDGLQLKSTGTRVQAHASRGFVYRFQDLSAGSYFVGASRSTSGAMDVMSEVTVGDGPTEHTLTLPRLDPAKYIVVNAVGPDGKRVEVKSARLSYRGTRRNGSRTGAMMKLPSGEVRVLHQTIPSNVRDPRRYIAVTSPTHGTTLTEYRKESVTELTVQFAPPATLEMTVAGHEKTRYADSIRVSLSRVVKEGNSTRSHGAGSSDFKGSTVHTFTGLQPGTYWAYLYAGSRRRVKVGRATIELGPGENSYNFDVPSLSQITVYGAQRYVRATRTSGGDRVRVTGVAGKERFVIDLLPPGTYEIRDGRGRKLTIAVPGTSEVRF